MVHFTRPRYDLRPGKNLNLRTCYNVSKDADRLRAREREKPFLLVGSSRCVSLPQLQSLARDSKLQRAMACDGLRHLTLMCELYKDQIDGRRFFLHEHLHKRKVGIFRCFMSCESLGRSMYVWIVVH